MQEIIWTVVVPTALAATVWGARWLAKRYDDRDILVRALAFVEAMGDRARDKYLMELAAAKATDSPGGQTITAEEMSALRASVWRTAVAEAPDAIREAMVREIGAEQGKAIIGAKIREASAVSPRG